MYLRISRLCLPISPQSKTRQPLLGSRRLPGRSAEQEPDPGCYCAVRTAPVAGPSHLGFFICIRGGPLMTSIQVRPFHRRDRQQLADLVNAHAAAVVPGMGVSVSAVLSELERQPGEFIVDPWVSERATLVAEQRDRVAAAAHLLRYYADERVGRLTAGLVRSAGSCSGPRPRRATRTGRMRRRRRRS